MKEVIVTCQSELDALPSKFEEYTRIIIRDAKERIYVKVARENSSVVARENSSVVARGNSSVHANSTGSIEAFIAAVVFIHRSFIKIKRLADSATAKVRVATYDTTQVNRTDAAQIIPYSPDPSFETWLERGYVSADGIVSKLVEQSKDGDTDVFKVADWRKKQSFVVRKGDKFSHGETLEEAKADLDYKLNGSDTTRFKTWNRKEAKPIGEMIVAYRAITGACSMGVREFIKGIPQLPKEISPEGVMAIIGGAYGASEFRSFFREAP